MKHKNTIVLLAALVLLLLVQRSSLILFGYSHISHPGIDEPVSGVLPCDILDAQLRAPLFAYEYLNRSGLSNNLIRYIPRYSDNLVTHCSCVALTLSKGDTVIMFRRAFAVSSVERSP